MTKKLRMRWRLGATQGDNAVSDVVGARLHILLVDDDEDDFVITRDLLAEIRGDMFDLAWVETYEAGLAAMQQNLHDVYLIDYCLGEKNGLKLLSEAIERGCTAPLILLTGQGDRSVDIEAMKRGAADYLVKGDLDAPSLERAIRYAIQQKQVEVAAQQLAVLHELDRAITTSLRISDIYHAFTQHAIRLLPYDHTSITLLENEQLRVTYVAGHGKSLRQKGDLLSLEHSVPGQAIHKGQPLIHNISREENTTLNEALWGEGIESSLIIPLRVKGQIIGTWNLGSTQRGVYNPDDLVIAQSMADQLAIVIENARLFSQARQEIAERKRVEEALRQSEEKYRTLIERMSEGLLQVDHRNVIQFVNDRFCEMMGYKRNELLGKSANTLLAHTSPNDTTEMADQFETQLRKKSGDLIWVQVGRAPVIDVEGKVVGSIRIHTDITERKRAEETRSTLEHQLRQSQKMEAVGTLAGGIAHDFNNLLTAIMGYAGLTLENLSEQDPIYNDIKGIQRTSERAADLTRQLLAFARRQMVELRVLNLNELVLNMGNMLRRLIGEDIELVMLPAPDLGLVKIDPGQFEQVIMNLAVNASDAMPVGGKLTIETANLSLDWNYLKNHAEIIPGEYVMLAVSDTGEGIASEIQSHIFEPFFTTKDVDRGTGLGLATCFGIVKQSNGHIWVYSEPGQGTTFKIYLPRIIQAETKSSLVENSHKLPTGTETVLLVEDEASLRDLSSRMLQLHGYTVLEAANGDEALRLVKQHGENNIDIVVTDVVMPQMGGKALADELKILRPNLKILFTSGYTDRAIVNHGMLEKGIDFLQKPFALDALIRRVRHVLDRVDTNQC